MNYQMSISLWEATILGDPRVKKSNQRVALHGRRPVKYNTAGYKSWQRSAQKQIKRAGIPKEPINYPVNLRCLFYKRTHGRVDLSALYEGIQDELVTMGVLEDDNFKIVKSHDGSRVYVDKDNPRIEVKITKAATL